MPPTSDDNTGHGERGTASIELVAAVPFLLLTLAVAAQIALAGQDKLWSTGLGTFVWVLLAAASAVAIWRIWVEANTY